MSRSGDRAADNSCNTDSDNSSSASPSSERKSGDFSISAILSDDTGGSSSRRKRGATARERRSSSGAVVSPPAAVDRTPHHMQQTGTTGVPLSTPSRFTSRLYPSPRPSSSSFSQLTPSATTPTSHWVGCLNQNMSLSPFNIGLFLPPSPSPTSGGSAGSHNRLDLEMTFDRESAEGGGGGRDEGFSYNDSLGMLSTVAVYHSELSGGEGNKEEVRRRRKDSGTNATLSVGDDMARMRLESSSDAVETTVGVEERRSTPPHPPSPSYRSTTGRGKGRTPCILKRDRKRPRQLAESFPQNQSSADDTATKATRSTPSQPPSSHSHNEPTTLNEGYLSPTSAQKSPHHSNLSFSPSIFLSQPANSSGSYRKRTISSSSAETHMETVDGHGTGRRQQDSESDTAESLVGSSSGHVREGGDQAGSSMSVTIHPPAVQVSRFVTSTPIKHDKENAQSSGLQISPTFLSPGETETKRPRLRDVNTYETSSGSDSDTPPVVSSKSRSRAQAVRHRSRARAQLSPLLENACSPIAKTDSQQRPPSSLLTANFPTSSGSAAMGPPLSIPLPPESSVKSSATTTPAPHHPSLTPTTPQPPPVSFPYLQTQLPAAVPFPFSAAAAAAAASAQYLPQPQPNLYMGVVPAAAVTTCNPLFPVPISPLSPPNTPYFIAPPPPSPHPAAIASTAAALFRPPSSSFYYGSTPRQIYGGYPPPPPPQGAVAGPVHQQSANVSQRWGSSPLSTQIQKTGQIQSVPPWFIFEQNRPEGKRLRLTEAINRSLSETPSHNPKLPAGWTKYACGQTDDQIQLTQRARLFLQSGRRQLTFDNIST